MFTLEQVRKAAIVWYGKTDIDSMCLAENRLMRGEKPVEYNHTSFTIEEKEF